MKINLDNVLDIELILTGVYKIILDKDGSEMYVSRDSGNSYNGEGFEIDDQVEFFYAVQDAYSYLNRLQEVKSFEEVLRELTDEY